MRVDHVVVPLVDGEVDRLADRPAGVVEPRRDVGELHEVAEVLDRPVAPSAVEVADEGRAVRGREDRVRAAEDDAALGVAGDLGELARRGRLHELAADAAREADALAVDVCAGVAEELDRVGGVAEVDPDLLEDRVGVLLDHREALLGEDLDRGERAGQERNALDDGVQPRCLAGGPAAARRPLVSLMRFLSRDALASAARGCGRAAGEPDRTREPRVRVDVVRDRHRLHEVLLEARLDRGLDLLDPAHDLLDLGAGGAVQERDARARPRGVPGCGDSLGVAVGDEPEDERVHGVDVRAERAGEPDPVDASRSRSAP